MLKFLKIMCLMSAILAGQQLFAGEADSETAVDKEPENPSEQIKLGVKLLDGRDKMTKDQPRAARLFAMAAEKGDAVGQYWLGWCFVNGRGVQKDDARAFELFSKSALQGYALGQFVLGCRYLNGEGVVKDAAKGVEWLEKSANQNCADAQTRLGLCYYNGDGVDKDAKKAFFWYSKAAEQGNPLAQIRLAGYYIGGSDGVEKDIGKAIKLLESAADKGNAYSRNLLATGYGLGCIIYKDRAGNCFFAPVERNPDKAIKYSELALKSTSCNVFDRAVLTSNLAIAHQMKGEWREALRILKGTPAKYFFLCLLLAYLAELAALLWAARKFRNSGAIALNPWRFGDLFTLAGLFIILMLGFSILSFALPFNMLLSGMLVSLFVFGVCALSFALVLKTRGSTLDKAFALDVPMQWKPLVAWTVVMVAGVGAFDYSYAWICERLGIKLNEQLAIKLFNLPNLTGFELAAVFLMGALILPVLEEVVFRGIAYQSLRTKANPWLAIPVSAAIFAAVHMDISAFLPIFVCGCALAYAFERTKNLRLPILIHCLNNIIALTCTLLERS